MKEKIIIREPKTEDEFQKYYDLRWQVLREPWSQPKGSEQDKMDKESTHIMAILDDKVIGCGRGHFNSKEQAQIRYMAVDNNFQRQKIGTEILLVLEENLIKKGAKEIILKARERAVSLYKKQDYRIYKEGEILFGEIKHYWMRKEI
ncbi:MAG: GNAT family N-acetyltransferase [Candidatus Tenebribacter burtonii]|jgi:ribosomal protein S18 acetylase RimI-like enzyme|nr:GNAT family N-acetyltransferase [Candidatus Tenebribacter burtonii]